MLSIRGVSKSYKDKHILRNINLEIDEGSVYTIFGPSGAGKTTLLNIIMGLSYKDEGDIIFKNNILQIPYTKSIRRNIAFIPDSPIYYDYLTGMENLAYLREIYNSNISDAKLEEYLDQFNLLKSKDKLFKDYSKGMKQKLMLLSTYISDASLIILDEPTVGLDLVSTHELVQIIRQYKQMKKTVLLATHDVPFSENVSDKFAVINHGSIVYKGENNRSIKLQDIVLEYLQKEAI
ncbi:ABC transporter ATP-binding protein [Sutcliffiella horikoshii]|uniref:ABC transporter ATP-binding protein n=1 Tax=Sutcliffiella horikoshii TaxID=79883 RepID=UPI00384B3D22